MSDTSPIDDLAFRIHHTMLPVADVERSIGFYTRCLGMKVMGRRSDDVRMVRAAHVGYGDRETQPSVELTQDVGPSAPARIVPASGHIAIAVNDLRRLCAVLDRQGVSLARPIKASGGPGSRDLTAWVRDPDGHLLELAERDPAP
jgi:lactoylglutathione lyase